MKKTASKTQVTTAKMTPKKPDEAGLYWGGPDAILVKTKKQGRGLSYTEYQTGAKLLARNLVSWNWSARIPEPDRG